MADRQFVDGLIVKPPHERAPDFVKAAISIKREELIAWLGSQSGDWINLDVKESKQGKWYAEVNDYKAGDKPNRGGERPTPRQQRHEPTDDDPFGDSIPF